MGEGSKHLNAAQYVGDFMGHFREHLRGGSLVGRGLIPKWGF